MISTLVNQTKSLFCKATSSESSTTETNRVENNSPVTVHQRHIDRTCESLTNTFMADCSEESFEALQGNIFGKLLS